MNQTKPLAETNNFIVLDKYTEIKKSDSYQSEADLEKELISIRDLENHGSEYRKDIKSQKA